MFETFDHTADVGLRARGATFEEVLTDAARGLLGLVVANPEAVRLVQEEEWEIAGDDSEYLLFDWLNAWLDAFTTRHLLLADFQLQRTATGLRAVVRGEPLDPQRHRCEHEVKAITYHGLVCREESAGWLAEVILDI